MVEVLYGHFYNNAIFEVRKENAMATSSKTGVNQTDTPASVRKGMFNTLFHTYAKGQNSDVSHHCRVLDDWC